MRAPAAPWPSLFARASACRACPRMAAHGRTAVLGQGNGPLNARVLFVAEAPGQGADCTRIPLHGDLTGDNFEGLLPEARLRREEVFVTNAVLCNPLNEQERNARPRASEIRNCSPFLQETIELLRPRVVVALGRTALDALGLIEPHGLVLASSVAQPHPWRGATLVPLYHPSPLVIARWRPRLQQVADYQALGRIAREAPP